MRKLSLKYAQQGLQEHDADRADVEHFDVAAYLTKPVDLEKFLWLVKELKQYWLAEVILPHVAEAEAPPPDGALSSTGSLGLFK